MKKNPIGYRLLVVALCTIAVLGAVSITASAATPEGLTYSIANDAVTITGYTGSATELEIPESIDGCPVTAIGAGAFSGNTTLTSVTIPKSLTTFGAGAFNNCTGLKAVHISDLTAWATASFQKDTGVSAWLSNPLYYAKNLYLNGQLITQLVIPEGITAISSDAFRNCTAITTIVIPEGVTIVGERCFMGLSNLTSVELPDTLVKIDGQAFRGCEKLAQIHIPENVNNIGGTAFNGCKSLTQIRLPGKLTSISNYMFQNCTGLTEITLPSQVTTVMTYAFDGCSSMTTVRIPACVTTINNYAFNNCKALTDVYFFGTQAQWDAITVGTNNSALTNAKLHILENHIHTYEIASVTVQPTWAQVGQAEKVCTACGNCINVALPVVAGEVKQWDVNLTNALQVNLHLDMNPLAQDNTKIEVAVDGSTAEYSVAELNRTDEGLYTVTVELAVVQMTEDITVALYNGDTVSTGVYSIRQYADTLLAQSQQETYHTLIKQLLAYGAAAQTYFDYNVDSPADADITGITMQDIPATAEKDFSVEGRLENVRFYGASLLFKDQMDLRIYFAIKDDVTGYTFTVNGKNVTPVIDEQRCYVDAENILPHRLDRQAVVTVTDVAGNTMTVRYSPINYMVRMYQKGSESLQGLMKALYSYYLATENYVSATPLPKLTMGYDDVLDLTDSQFGLTADTAVSVNNIMITSKQTGTNQKDTAVLTYDAATQKLWATGTGSAQLTIDDEKWIVTVEPAPISLFLIGGHSVSAGVGGNPAHSVVSQQGQVYSTYESYITDKVDDSWGWEYNWSFSQTSAEQLQTMGLGHYAASRPETIDALTQGNSGTYGSGSALAYEWNRLTGEKVWVINAGHGGMGLTEWSEGAMDYVHASSVFRNAQIVLKNEIAAGHYTLGRMEYFYFSCANGDQTWFTEDYQKAFLSMWNGFKNDFSTDMDGDGDVDTISSIGLVPHWRPSGQSFVEEAFNNGQSYNYFMAASQDYPDVYIASSFCRGFDRNNVSQEAIAAFYPENLLCYELQDGTDPNSLIPTVLKGYTGNAVFPDQIHVAQLTQNVQGILMARSLFSNTSGKTAEDVTLYKPYGINTVADGETITLNTMESFRISAMLVDGARGEMSFEVVGDAITAQGTYITAGKTAGTAQLLVKLNGEVLKTVNFNVVEPAAARHTHCHCGGTADHSCDSDIIWTAWTSTNSLPTESGYYYLTADVNLTNYANILNGNNVRLCLNGHTVNKVYTGASGWVGRIYQISDSSQLTVCDCTGKGVINGSSTNQNGGHFILLQNAKLNWYGGSLVRDNADETLTSSTTYGGLVYVYDTAEMNVYGGSITGGSATNGGSIYAAGTVNVYGGTISGGTATNGGNIYVASTGTVNVSGGKVENGVASSNGGNIFVLKDGMSNVSSGTISGGTATTSFGGNIYVNGSLEMTGGTVIGGTGVQGGNIMLSGGVVNISGGYILDGVTNNEGGNLKAIGGTVTISGGIMAGGKAGYGGNIAIGGGADSSVLTVHMTSGTVTGGTAGNGGNVYVHNGAFNMSGGNLGSTVTVNDKTYTGGSATGGKQNYGGNVYICADTLMQLSKAAVIENGYALTGGGNIYNLGFLKLTGGSVVGGVAGTNGGNINGAGGEFVMYDGTVSGGTAVQGGNININGGTMTMSGGSLIDGKAINESVASQGWGGNLYVKTTVLLKGSASLTGGYGQVGGGNVHIAGGGSFTMNGVDVNISGGSITASKKSNDLNQLQSSADRTVDLLQGTVGTTVYADESLVDPTQTEFDTFVAGYGKADVTPFDPVYLGSYQNAMERRSTGVRDPFYAMTTALTDTEGNTLLIITTDLSWGHENQLAQVRAAVLEKYGIPGENVLLGGTHNHSGAEWYAEGWQTPENQAYLSMWLDGVLESVEIALADRKPAQLHIGRTETENIGFVRRYYCADGTVTGTGPQTHYVTKLEDVNESNPIVGHETEGDEQVQLVKLTRDGGKDIIIGQWQAHAAHDGGTTIATTDWVGYAREKILAEVDCEFMYMQGAAGNMSTSSLIAEEYTTKTTKEVGQAVAAVIITACQNDTTFTDVNSGSIQVKQVRYEDVNARGGRWSAEMNSVAIGDLSLVTLPVELYAESGIEIKEGTPFDMTLIMGYTNGICSYVGTNLAFQNGGYGINDGRGTENSADTMVDIYIESLEELYEAGNG